MQLRDYQERIVQMVRQEVHAGHKRILVVLPTGGGKGVVAAKMMEMAAEKGNDSIFFADQRELIYQLGAHLDRMELPNQVLMAGVKNEFESYEEFDKAGHCTLAAKDTLWSRRKKIEFPEAKLVQADEVHKSLARTWKAVLDHYEDSIIVGWTATPCRGDGKPLGNYYTSMVQGATYQELQAGGHLLPVKAIAPVRVDLKGLKSARGDYVQKQLENRMNQDAMVGDIIKEWKQRSEGRQTIVFASGIGHSLHIRNEFDLIGVKAEHIDGTIPVERRNEIMERLKAGEIKVICNFGVLTTGVDVPGLSYMICARPTKSFGLWRQMGGRIQRPSLGQDHCFIQDHSNNCWEFGYPDEDVEWDIDGTKKIQDKIKEKKAKEPIESRKLICKKCASKFSGTLVCPNCGTMWERPPDEIKMEEGVLKEIERKRLNRNSSKQEKQEFWNDCLGWAIGTGRKIGAASHRYKERYGVWPRNLDDIPRGGDESRMNAREFYNTVVKKERVKREQQTYDESEVIW